MKAFVVTVPTAVADVAADRLWTIGVRGIEERSGPGDDEVELWTAVGEEPESLAAAGDLVAEWSWRVEDVDPAPADTWREHARAVVVADRVVVAPAWQHDAEPVGADQTLLRIEPGAAFGLGDHATTRLTLELLIDELDARADRGDAPSMLDVGCGTGVLAIAAALLGAPNVRAVDTSAAAVEATLDNADRNGVGGGINVDGAPLGEVEGRFDIVVANILAPTLCALADDLIRSVAPGGSLIISGVLEGRHSHVLEALRPLTPSRTIVEDGWAAVVLA